jgi:aspartyl-tRNA(Asn)/glutamyl-tRNA(Gln) amidotransferase subunit C
MRKVNKLPITKKEIEQMATLSRLELSEEEKESYTTEINNIFSFIEELNKLDTSSVDITVHAIPICNIFREDVVGETLELGKALQNAPDEKDGQYRVPRIL